MNEGEIAIETLGHWDLGLRIWNLELGIGHVRGSEGGVPWSNQPTQYLGPYYLQYVADSTNRQLE